MALILTNGRLLDCIGEEAVEDVSLIIKDSLIQEIHPGRIPIPEHATVIDVGGMTIMPGLTDANVHVTLYDYDIWKTLNDPPIVVAAKTMKNLETLLEAGFTTVRDLGMANLDLKQAVEDDLIPGPRLLICCSQLTPTAGHGDMVPPGVVLKDTGLRALPRLVDGVSEARKGSREQLKAGADHLKIMASGGLHSPYTRRVDNLSLSDEEIRAIVEEAENVGIYAAAHALGNRSIKQVIRCGVRSIEHGVLLDEEAARMLKEKDFFFVPNVAPIYLMLRGDLLKKVGHPEFSNRKMAVRIDGIDLYDHVVKSVEIAYRTGCNIASGSDVGTSFGWNPALEIKMKTTCGMSAYDAIKSATLVNARLFCMEDKIGSIESGKWADIIVVDGKPEIDPEVLADEENVKIVMKKGRLFKNKL